MKRRRGPVPERDQVDAVPRVRILVPLSVQHVLIAYSGLLTVPLLVGTGVGLPPDQVAALITANLFVSGLATILQSVGVLNIGVRLPVVMGSTFTGIGPAIIVAESGGGLPAVFGATMAVGAATFLIAPYFSRLIRFFPQVVTGTIIAIIGLSLVPSAAKMIAGDGGEGVPAPSSVLMALGTVAFIVLIERFAPASVGRLAVLLALIAGTAAAVPMGLVDVSGVRDADPVGVVSPFAFGWPVLVVGALVPMLIVQLVNMVETTGDPLAIGRVVGRGIGPPEVARALRADGLATFISGMFNSFTIVTHGANIGMVSMTRVYSRWVVALGGLLMMVLGLVPMLGVLVAALPGPVLGAVGLVMFAMVGSVGLRILFEDDMTKHRNMLLVAVSFGMAFLPIGAPGLYDAFPDSVQTVLGSGIAVGAITAFVLNLLLNGVPAREAGRGAPGAEGPGQAGESGKAGEREPEGTAKNDGEEGHR